MMEGIGKSITVKDWFANKIAKEIRRNISFCDVFAIIKETDKAIYAMLNLGTNFSRTMWIPKSVLVERDVVDRPGEKACYETIRASYEEAEEEFARHWSQFI